MAKDDIIQCAIVAGLCFIMIIIRTLYRIFCSCKIHTKCHRRWHRDDLWMTFAILPLIGRAITIAWSAELLSFPPGASDQYKKDARVLSGKLLMPGRIFYLTFLWCCKFCLLELYLRLSKGLPVYRRIGEAIRWSLYLTWIAVCLATFLECRPIRIAWNGDPAGHYCRKARANLITMASCNIVTDIFLILFPISIIRRSGLDLHRLLRLSLLFALGSLVILTTIIRVPLILRDDAQKTRSQWASVEITIACFIAQAPFFQAVYVDRRVGHHSASSYLNTVTNTHTHPHTPNPNSRAHISSNPHHHRSQKRSSLNHLGNSDRSSNNLKKGSEEDEIGLWTIEKRVSYSVSGRTRASGEFDESERDTSLDRSSASPDRRSDGTTPANHREAKRGFGPFRDRGLKRDGRGEGVPPTMPRAPSPMMQGDGFKGLNGGMGIVVSREVQVVRDDARGSDGVIGDDHDGKANKVLGRHASQKQSRRPF